MFGLILIAAGIALAAAAFVVVYRGREAEELEGEASRPAEKPAEKTPPKAGPATVGPPLRRPGLPPAESAPVATPVRVPPESRPPIAPEAAPPVLLPGEPTMTDQPPILPPAPGAERRLLPVVTILRDEVSGELALQVGNRTYRSQDELKASADWTRVDYAARDLARWLQVRDVPTRQAEERRDGATVGGVTGGGGTMIEQINRILEGKLADQPASSRAVRLVEGPGGTVRVYIGVQSFNLDEVPDPAIRSTIREAVAEWEARQ